MPRPSPPTRSRACTSPTRVLAALLYRERTGEAPGYVEVPMFELMAAFSLCEHLSAATFEEDGKVGYVRVISPSRRPYKTKDGWVGVLPYTERNWTKVLTEIGRADVAELRLVQERHRAQPARRRALRHPGRGPAGAHDGGMARRSSSASTSPPSRCALPADLLTDPHLADVGFFTPNFAADTPGHAHAAPGHERRGDDRRRRTCPRRCSAPIPPTCCARPAAARRRSPRPCRTAKAAPRHCPAAAR